MTTKQRNIIILLSIAVLAALIVCTLLITQHTENTEQMPGTGNAAVGANGASSIITYSDTGFSPTPLTLAVGTTATWSNQSSHSLSVSDRTAKDDDCKTAAKDTMLNECASISKDGSFSYTFTQAGTYMYINRNRPADTGIIYVTADSIQAGKINPEAIPQ